VKRYEEYESILRYYKRDWWKIERYAPALIFSFTELSSMTSVTTEGAHMPLLARAAPYPPRSNFVYYIAQKERLWKRRMNLGV
jgi:hypothetical protein